MTSMPSPIQHLKNSLENALVSRTERERPFGKPELLQKKVEVLKGKLNAREGAMPQNDRIHAALKALCERGAVKLYPQELRYVCWGVAAQYPRMPRLIEDRRLFPALLAALETQVINARCWRGLWFGYLHYSPSEQDAAGHENWLILRRWLFTSFEKLYKQARSRPSWMEVLRANLNLLGEFPTRKYAPALLRGEMQEIESLEKELKIPEESWFWRDLVLSQVIEVVSLRDQQFKDHIERLIPHLKEHESVKHEGLAKLLDRYARCDGREKHEALKTFALEAWGSPQLTMQSKWGLVKPEAKQMVMEWLALEDLEDFFSLLQADGVADRRRLKYWLRYVKQMSFTRIVLGAAARNNPHTDYIALRKRKGDRISFLKGTTSSNNAVVMKIGSSYFVEFTEKGNACYGYSEDSLPVRLESRELHIYSLKRERVSIFRERHADTRIWGLWENKFEHELSNLGITPEKERTAPARMPTRVSTVNRHENKTATEHQQHTSQRWFEAELKLFVQQHQLKTQDHRAKGGAIWVFHFAHYDEIAEKLKVWGFKLAPGKGYWKT